MEAPTKVKLEEFDRIETVLGTVTILRRRDGKIEVLIDDDITATFNEEEFIRDFVL